MHRESLIEEINSELSDDDLLFIGSIVEEIGRGSEFVIPILQAIQDRYRYLPKSILQHVCEITEITPSQITGVSTFYSQFRHQPVGQHVISVCHGTACHVKGSGLIQDALYRQLGISGDEDTDAEGIFTVQKVACLGCCTLAPVIQIDGITYGHLTSDVIPKVLDDFLSSEHSLSHSELEDGLLVSEAENLDGSEIRLGLGSCCIAKGSDQVRDALLKTVRKLGIRTKVKRVGCVGICHQTPLVEIVMPDGRSFLYARVLPQDVEAIVLRHFKPRGILRKITNSTSRLIDNMLTDDTWTPISRYSISVRDPQVSAFLDKQKHIATEYSGNINPTDLDEYLENDGFKALKKCLTEMTPEQVIDEIKKCGLRGRGGAGFPTNIKWSLVKNAEGAEKYVICNGDEGDPGAFMDRMLLESYPYRIIEGIAISAYVVGADEGYFYIRAEYPLAVQRIKEALVQCEERGFLGEKIFGSNFRFIN